MPDQTAIQPPPAEPLGDPRLRLEPAACLAWRGAPTACTRCAEACPAQALAVGDDGPRLVKPCLGCGRCAAACPSGALACAGFAPEPTLRQGNAALAIECARVPSALAKGRVQVPCLGGIRLSQALAWVAQPGRLRFIDRGACADCAAGGAGPHPAAGLVAELDRILDACGWPAPARPGLTAEPAPAKLEPLPEGSLAAASRRGFLRRIARPASSAAPRLGQRSRRQIAAPLPEREKTLAWVRALAARENRPTPATLLPRLDASARCSDCGVCVGLCPTGALARDTAAATTGLVFDAARCLACARCVDGCPEQALALGTRAATAVAPLAPEPLAAFALRTCRRCLNAFSAGGDALECDACRRRATLARDLFGMDLASRQRSS